MLLTLFGATPAAAQDVDISFSSEIVDSYGFPELHVTFNGSGFDVPTEVEAGYHVVVLTPTEDIAAYVDFMQPAPASITRRWWNWPSRPERWTRLRKAGHSAAVPTPSRTRSRASSFT